MPQNTHTFAWNGISFDVPLDWNLSAQHTFKGVTNIAMEDDVSVRLHLEWTKPKSEIDTDTIRKRFAKASRKLVKAADNAFPVQGVPRGWSAIRYKMPDAQELLIAYYLDPGRKVFCFFQFYFNLDALPRPLPTLKLVTSSFRVEDGPVLPWRVYDIGFTLHRDFKLSMSSLLAGQKLLVFEWALRRLFVWHVSLADMVLREKTLTEWVVEHLNAFPPIRAVHFSTAPDGAIYSRRKRRYPFGHYEEIGRQCFQYHTEYQHLKDRNQIVLWLCHFRRPADVKKVQETFRVLAPR